MDYNDIVRLYTFTIVSHDCVLDDDGNVYRVIAYHCDDGTVIYPFCQNYRAIKRRIEFFLLNDNIEFGKIIRNKIVINNVKHKIEYVNGRYIGNIRGDFDDTNK